MSNSEFQKLHEIVDEESLGVAFAIETICHSPDHVKCFQPYFEYLLFDATT